MTTSIQPAGATQGFNALFDRPAPTLKAMPAFPKHLIALAGSQTLDDVVGSVDDDGAVVYAHPSYRIFGGGSTQWRANEQNPENYQDHRDKVVGITIAIAQYRAYRGYDSGKVDDRGDPIFFRTCASLNMKEGMGNPGGICINCRVRWRNQDAPEKSPEHRGCENRTRIIVVADTGLPIILDLTGAASTGTKSYMRSLPDLPQRLVSEWSLTKHPKYPGSALVVGKPIGKFKVDDRYTAALEWHMRYWAHALKSWQEMIAAGADSGSDLGIVEGSAAPAIAAPPPPAADNPFAQMLTGGAPPPRRAATTNEPPPPPPWDEDDGDSEEIQYDLDGNPVPAGMAF